MKKNKYGDVLALIPARGGSKSVPRKNSIEILGKPLIAWTIECALDAEHITRVIVTTDDEEIAALAIKYGAEVPFLRPEKLAGDYSLDVEFHRHALEWLRDNDCYIPEMVINLRPTAPYREYSIIDKAIETFASNDKADSLRSVHLSTKTPYKMWFIENNGFMKPVAQLVGVDEPYNQPRQKLPLVYWQDGYIDITRPSVIFEKNSTTGDLIVPFIIEKPAVDIDYHEDIKKVELQLQINKGNKGLEQKPSVFKHPS